MAHPLDATPNPSRAMSLLIGTAWAVTLLAVFTVQVGVQGIKQLIRSAFHDCRDMTRVEHFYPKYKHTK